MAHYTVIEQVLDKLKDMIETAPTLTELQHVGYADDEMFFNYPAVILTGEPVVTEIHGTHKFENHFRVGIFIYHAQADESRTVRTRNDLLLCTKVRTVLHSNHTLTGGVVFGHVISNVPGTIRRPGNVMAIGSRLTWYGRGIESF